MSSGSPWRVLPPVPGSAPGIRTLADAVEATGRRLADACGDLVRLRDGAVWDGPAGTAFGARIDAVPTVLDRAARRHLCAARPLRSFADVLETEQAVVQRTVEDHAEAADRYVVLEARATALVAAGRTEDDPELLVVRALQREQVATVMDAERRHRAASDRLEAADAHCAATLRALADDGLADPAAYRGLRGASSLGHGVGAVAGLGGVGGRLSPHLRLAGAVGDGVGLAADTSLLLGYGEGSWSRLGTDAGLTALGTGGDVLRVGAKAGAVVRADGTVVAVSRLSAQERIVLGAGVTARRKVDDARSLLDLPPDRGTASVLLGGPPVRAGGSVLQRGLRAGGEALRTRYRAVRTELALASAGGRSTQRMYAAGVTLQVGARGGEQLLPDAEAPPSRTPRTLRSDPDPRRDREPGRSTTGGPTP